MNMERKGFMLPERRRIIIYFDVVLLVMCGLYAVTLYRGTREAILNVSNIRTVSESDGFAFDIESVRKYKEGLKKYLSVKGWAIEKNVDSKAGDTIKIVLKSVDTGDYYTLPTARQTRQDITTLFYDGTVYDDSGFVATLLLQDKVNPYADEYEIYILLNNGEGKKLLDTNTRFNEWIEENRE